MQSLFVQALSGVLTSRSNGRTERGVKRRTNLTVALDDIMRKCRRHGAARCHLSGALRTVGFSWDNTLLVIIFSRI